MSKRVLGLVVAVVLGVITLTYTGLLRRELAIRAAMAVSDSFLSAMATHQYQSAAGLLTYPRPQGASQVTLQVTQQTLEMQYGSVVSPAGTVDEYHPSDDLNSVTLFYEWQFQHGGTLVGLRLRHEAAGWRIVAYNFHDSPA